MKLYEAQEGKEYIVKNVVTNDEELNSFLFSLGCYDGEYITVISRRKSGCIITIKDGRYSIDSHLAKAIEVYWIYFFNTGLAFANYDLEER